MKYKLEFYSHGIRRWKTSYGQKVYKTFQQMRHFVLGARLCGYRVLRITGDKKRVVLYGGNKRALIDAGVR